VKASLHRGNACSECICDLGVAAALLDKGNKGAVLGSELRERVAQRVELLRVNSALRLGNILVLRGEGNEHLAQSLAMQVFRARRKSQDSNCSGALRRSIARAILTKTIWTMSSTESLRPVMA